MRNYALQHNKLTQDEIALQNHANLNMMVTNAIKEPKEAIKISSVRSLEKLKTELSKLRADNDVLENFGSESVEIEVNGEKHLAILEFTKDPALLKQYYDLREESYKNEWGFENYDGSENEHDRTGEVLVVKVKDKIFGGARVTFSDGNILSNEDVGSDFTYEKAAKHAGIDLKHSKYCEVSALVLKKEFRSRGILTAIFKTITDYSKECGAQYIFGTSNLACNRSYSITLKQLGYRSQIVKEMIAPKRVAYNYIEMLPLIVYL